MNLKLLTDPFPEEMVEWRIGQAGIKNGRAWATCLAYIQSRAIMDRLDDVCGPENWKVEYAILNSGILATLSIKCGSEWVSKQDGAEPTDIESFKGGISSALKRAGSVWGIGRYLYDLDAGFATTSEGNSPGMRYAKTKDNQVFYWSPPKLPDWALPKGSSKPEPQQTEATGSAPVPVRQTVLQPKTSPIPESPLTSLGKLVKQKGLVREAQAYIQTMFNVTDSLKLTAPQIAQTMNAILNGTLGGTHSEPGVDLPQKEDKKADLKKNVDDLIARSKAKAAGGTATFNEFQPGGPAR